MKHISLHGWQHFNTPQILQGLQKEKINERYEMTNKMDDLWVVSRDIVKALALYDRLWMQSYLQGQFDLPECWIL